MRDSDFGIKTAVLNAYDVYADAIFRHCLYRLFDEAMAEDYTQETFLRLYEYLHQGKQVKHVKSFLYRTANNLIIDKKRKKQEASLDTLMHAGFNPEGQDERFVMNGADAALVFDMLRHVEEVYRTPLLMRYVDNLKPKEIAELLGESQNVISVRIHRGLKKIQELARQ